jgi:hypothetical protein
MATRKRLSRFDDQGCQIVGRFDALLETPQSLVGAFAGPDADDAREARAPELR